jgi:hypothetical protein
MPIDWTNPTVLVGLLALVGVAITAASGIVGAIVGARIAAAAVAREGHRQRDDVAATRVREWNIRRLEETRTQLASIADGFLALMDNKDGPTSKAHLQRANTMLFANARLVGDRAALAAMAAAVVGATSALPANRIYRALLVAATNPFTDEQRAAMRDARSLVLAALDRQHELALRDQPILELSSAEIASIPALGLADDGLAALRKDAADDVSA